MPTGTVEWTPEELAAFKEVAELEQEARQLDPDCPQRAIYEDEIAARYRELAS